MSGVTIGQLKDFVFMVDVPEKYLQSVYYKVKDFMYKYAEDTKENIAQGICDELGCNMMAISEYNSLKAKNA